MISGEKDARLKVRMGAVDDVALESIQRSFTKPEFVSFVKQLKVIHGDLLRFYELQSLGLVAIQTATRIGTIPEHGIEGIRLRDINLERDPPIMSVWDKKTKRRPTGEWVKRLPPICFKAMKMYLARRYDTSTETAAIKQVIKEHGEDKLFPEKYTIYVKLFREGLNAIGLIAIDRPFHSMRHAFVDWMILTELGTNLLAIATLGGWDNVDTMIEWYFGGTEALLDGWMNEATGTAKREPIPFEKGLEELPLQ